MKTVTMYSKDHCPNCEIAHAHALVHGVQVQVVKLTPSTIPAFKEAHPTVRTVPFILFEDTVIGGLQELKEWVRANT